MNVATVQDVLNVATLTLFVALLGSGLFGMIRRVILFQRASEAVPVLMKRDIGLLAGLAIVGLESLGLRALGITQMLDLERLLYTAQQDLAILIPLAYWVKVELWDVDDPNVP